MYTDRGGEEEGACMGVSVEMLEQGRGYDL